MRHELHPRSNEHNELCWQGCTGKTAFAGRRHPQGALSCEACLPPRFRSQRIVAGIKKQNGLSSFEIFGLTNVVTLLNHLPNIYSVDGAGPDYTYTNGLAILSRQKKIAFAFDIITGRTTRAPEP